MKQVATQIQWAANTISFVDDDGVYLRLSNSLWYELIDSKWNWIEDSHKVEESWLSRSK